MERELELQEVTSTTSRPAQNDDNVKTVIQGFTGHLREAVAKVTDLKLGKSAPLEIDEGGQNDTLISIKSQRQPSYGSFPSTSITSVARSSSLGRRPVVGNSEARRDINNSSLMTDQYLKEFADLLPTITVEKFSNSETYPADLKFASFINPKPTEDLLSVDVIPKSVAQGDNNSQSSNSSGFNSEMPSPGGTMAMDSSTSGDEAESDEFTWLRYFKIFIVALIFLLAAGVITITNENKLHVLQISASKDTPYSFRVSEMIPFSPWYPLLTVSITGSFATPEYENTTSDRLRVSVRKIESHTGESEVVSEVWEVPIIPDVSISEITLTHSFSLKNLSEMFIQNLGDNYMLHFETTTKMSFPMFMSLRLLPRYIENGALFGGLVIIGLYVLIIFELINRTLSAMLAAAVAIGVLSVFHQRPTTEEMVSWLDMETLILLFSMMIMVSILCETGFFNYCAFLMYKLTNGAIWPMITSLCIFTGVVSAFLDNVTTILLMTPVTIRICEAMHLNPVPVLISIVVFSNIGGAATPVGDPPNAIIANDPDVIKAGIDFTAFVSHMFVGILLVAFVSYIQLRITFRSMSSLQFEVPYVIAELKREIDVWTRAFSSLSQYSRDEGQVRTILKTKVLHMKSELKIKKRMGGQTMEGYQATLAELEESCRIKDWPLLVKCAIVLSLVIILFFMKSVPELKLSMGWTALLGAVFLLILADRKELEGILARVEWSTLIFFSALFIVMEAVSKLGLLDWIGAQTEAVILHVHPEARTIVAIHIILWVSGIASAFIDNIPLTTMMVKIVTRISMSLQLPLSPLVWALAFGTCLGGNGTIIGASANVVCAGVADQHGYRFSFLEYFRIGFPMMIVSLIVSSAYLTACYYLGFY